MLNGGQSQQEDTPTKSTKVRPSISNTNLMQLKS